MLRKNTQGWTATKALIYSVEWIEPNRDDYGHYDVVFSYRVNEERYTGRFSDYGKGDETYMRRDDTIDVLYNPASPEENHYPLVRTARNKRVAAFSIGLALGAVALLILFFRGGFK